MRPLVMTILILISVAVFTRTALKRWKLMKAARTPVDRSDHPWRRFRNVLWYGFGQARMFRYKGAGVAHAFIFGGFVVLLLRALILFARGYSSDPGFGFWIFNDGTRLGNAYLFLKEAVVVLVFVGVIYFLRARLLAPPKRIALSAQGIVILCMILGIVLTDVFYDATGHIKKMQDEHQSLVFHAATPVASVLSFVLLPEPGSEEIIAAAHEACFWLHAVLILVFLNVLPLGKHFHILTVLPNIYFADTRGIGRLRPLDDIEGQLEREETLGVKTAADLSWKDVLDLYTCTECGRCSDHCPATITGKQLSPMQLTIDLRDHLVKNQARILGASESGGAADDATDSAADDELQLVPGTIQPEVLWACTTCGACEQECPVFISFVDKIVDLRRNLVMEQGEFPAQLQNAFRGLETVGNVYSFANEQRADWADGLDIPLLSDKPDAQILYWVGCAPSFDDRARKIARAMANLLRKAGVDFAILGPQEQCTGDPARRAGNEYLYQTLAKSNIETLNGYSVRKIVTTCPHCFNTLANEYPELGGRFEVVHHSVFLAQLVREGKLEPKHRFETTLVYHDACYLGRHNGVYDAPREMLAAIPGVKLVEAAESRDRGMCCGAGGAQMWKEEEPGDGKVNHARANQLLKVLPSGGESRAVSTACPFCMTMLRDGFRDQGHDAVQPLDLAEILWRSVNGPGQEAAAADRASATN